MYNRFKFLFANSFVLLLTVLALGGILPIQTVPGALAQSVPLSIVVSAPSYVTAGSNITYEITVKNLTNQQVTDIGVFSGVPTNTSYVSGGNFDSNENGAEFELASLAAHASHQFTFVVKANNGVAVDTFIVHNNNQVYKYTHDGETNTSVLFAANVGTTVEAPGTVLAIYKNSSGRAFDVKVDGFQFENYGSGAPGNRSDDLLPEDLFRLFGPGVCDSGTTAETCGLTGPAKEWRDKQLKSMNGGHCEGMAATSLHIFDRIGFKGNVTPGDIQSGASNTINLHFPDPLLENYIAYYFSTQSVKEYHTNEIYNSPVAIMNILERDFKKNPPIPYTLGFFLLPDFKVGHAVTAYGVEKVSATESRILVYDNNFPKQRQYLTVNTAANTWRYETAAIPGQDPDIYTGTATSDNLSIVPNKTRDLAAGNYFTCPFCKSGSLRNADSGMVEGEIDIQYTGEGAILVINDEGEKTGADHISETFVNEITNTQIIHFKGGLGQDIPPRIIIPFVEEDDTFYSILVHGKTATNITSGSLSITGPGFVIGVNDIELDPQELFEFTISPDGDHIAFTATEVITAPGIFISHDPIHSGDPSVIFDVEGVTLQPNERVSLDLDPELERIHFKDTGAGEENFDIAMELIWPDGDTHAYTETVHIPAGTTSAFIDFGAWDGLLHPPTYIDDVLQNPSVNHRLKLESSTGSYDSTPQANAPAGVYRIEATFSNVTEVSLENIYFSVANLGAGNVVLNADSNPTGIGAKISVPNTALGNDEILHTNDSFTFTFEIGLASGDSSSLTVDANGVPHDWIHPNPAPAYDANNASFVLGDQIIFLPMILK